MATLKLGTTTAITESSGKLTLGTPLGKTFASMQVFTADGTWTPTDSNVSAVFVIVTGGGGGGGGTDNEGANGGGGGGTSLKWITSGLGSSEDVTVGDSGVANAWNSAANITAGTSSFGSHCTATGGGTGGYWSRGGPGGAGTTSTGSFINILGGDGAMGQVDTGHSQYSGQTGGSSYWGGGGSGASAWFLTPQPGLAYGSGGGGGRITTQSAVGKAGIIVVYEYKG